MMPSLFQLGETRLHSGSLSGWKIDCDHLTDGDIETLALIMSKILPAKFGHVALDWEVRS